MSSKNTDVIAYIESRLQEWAEWFSRGNLAGIGYPNRSIEYRIYREGGVLIKGTGEKPSPVNEAAEEIEKLVKEMAMHNQLLASVLRCHYFSQGSLRIKSKRVGISHTQFKHYVDMAHWWLVGRISIKNRF